MIVVDTGPLVAISDEDDASHATCLEALAGVSPPLVVPAPVLVEVCYLLERNLGPPAEAAFLRSFADGSYQLEATTPGDLARMAELVDTYHDLPLGSVDASVVAIAERLGVATIATLDRRHFSVVRPRHLDSFSLIPA